jgi:hypothetical protein
MNTTELRRLAILLLDDPHGISRLAFDQFIAMTGLTGFQDIYGSAQHDKGRVFLPEDHGLKGEPPHSSTVA